MSDRPATPLLDRISRPADLKHLSDAELTQVAHELRAETISAVSVTGGHLGAGLGVTELTVALHAVFDTPKDKIIWDVGHQCYPHKILTERRDRIRTLRMKDGLSGFTKRSESPYDPFGAAHSSTSISAALGFAVARDLGGNPPEGLGDTVAVIGDGAMSAGMAFEAMNNAGHLKKRMFVILNDNEMSIAPPVGALSSHLSRLYAEAPLHDLKAAAKGAVSLLPGPFREGAKRAKEMLKGMAMGGSLFEALGFSYIGPIDGHDMDALLPILRTMRTRATGPVLLHVLTRKGKGYAPAERARDKGAVERAQLYPHFWRRADPAGGRGRQDLRGDGGDARWHRAEPVCRTLSQPLFRRGHCGTARGDLFRRAGRGRDEAVLRDVFHLLAARL